MIDIHPSSMFTILRCPGSLHLAKVSEYNEAGDLGTALHKRCARIVAGEKNPRSDNPDLDFLTNTADRLWKRHCAWWSDPITEQKLYVPLSTPKLKHSYRLVGTPDVVATVTGSDDLAIGDWKSERDEKPEKAWAQVEAYSFMLMLLHSHVEKVYGAVFWLREGDLEARYIHRAGLQDWQDRLLEALCRGEQAQLTTGIQCSMCNARAFCPALRSTLELTPAVRDELTATPNMERITDLYYRLKAFKSLISQWERALKAYVTGLPDESLQLSDGRTIAIVPEYWDTILPTDAVLSTLSKTLTEEERLRVLRVGKTELEKIIKDHAPTQKGKAAAEFFDTLRTSGNMVKSLHAMEMQLQKPKEPQ